MKLDQWERSIVEAFGVANTVRLIVNEGAEDSINILIRTKGADYADLRRALRLAMLEYFMNCHRLERRRELEALQKEVENENV